MTWRSWDKERPEPGARVVIIETDGSVAFTALVLAEGVTESGGYTLGEWEVVDTLWAKLPDGMKLAFEP